MIPLVPVDSSYNLSTSNNTTNNNNNNNTSGNGNVTTQIPICEMEVETSQDMDRERWYTIFLQILFPFLIAGLGMVAAGVVLDKVQVGQPTCSEKKELLVLILFHDFIIIYIALGLVQEYKCYLYASASTARSQR